MVLSHILLLVLLSVILVLSFYVHATHSFCFYPPIVSRDISADNVLRPSSHYASLKSMNTEKQLATSTARNIENKTSEVKDSELTKEGAVVDSESLMESLSRMAGFMQQQQEKLVGDNTGNWETSKVEEEMDDDESSSVMTEDQKRDLEKSITRFGSTEEAMNGMDILSSASVVIRASAAATRTKGATNVTNISSTSSRDAITKRKTGTKRRLLKAWTEKVLNAAVSTGSKTASTIPQTKSSNMYIHSSRISRDIRDVAVSIASNIDNLEQWRLFCNEGGGLQSIFRSLRLSARLLSVADSGEAYTIQDVQAAFNTSSAACRALRDLCALSPELSAVITEDILEASSSKSFYEEEHPANNENGQKSGDSIPRGVVASLVSLLIFSTKECQKEHSSLVETAKLCRLYSIQMFLAMALASDAAVYTLRATPGLVDSIVQCSSYANYKPPFLSNIRRRRIGSLTMKMDRSQLIETLPGTLDSKLRSAANQVLAALGHNIWVPKRKGQKGLRILCLDGGGTRGIAAITILRRIVKATGGIEACDAFDVIAGTSTGAIISFLVALRRESSEMARKRYNMLIKRIFVKSPLSTPMLIFTTASYDESHFMEVMEGILGDNSMLGSRADPDVPFVFAVSSKMSSSPTQVCLFRNYNYAGGELPDAFVIDPLKARGEIGLAEVKDQTWSAASLVNRQLLKTKVASRHPGSFRVPQKVALRATTAAPTVFKPVLMGGELYCDGGMLASNPSAIAIHEARSLFPDIPIELVVSLGTGAFVEEKSSPRIGWDGIITQIVNSATDAEQPHHILEDILGQGGTARLGRSNVSKTRYYRFNPIIGGQNDFPLDGTDPKILEDLSRITDNYMSEDIQERKLDEISKILHAQQARRFSFQKLFCWKR